MKAIQEIIIKMLVLKPLMSLFDGGTGIGGTLLSLFGGKKNALGNAFDGGGVVNRFANGGAFTNGVVSKPTLFSYANGSAFGEMGEAGPEAIMPLSRGPDGSLGVQMHGNGNSGGTNVNYAPVYQVSGPVSQADIDRLEKQAANDRRNFKSQVLSTMSDARKRGANV